MRVAIDIRRAGDFGVGTYIRNIVNQLAQQDRKTSYLLIGRPKHLEEFTALPENFELLEFNPPPSDLRSHLHLPVLLAQRDVDLLHVPWFHAPAWVPCRLVLTVHDLTDLIYPPAGASRMMQAARLYMARRTLGMASRILSVSQSSRRDLARAFAIPESKIEVVYNALDERFAREPMPPDADRVLERHAVNYPFVLYAGNIRPHKNLARMIEAFAVAKAELAGHEEFAHLKLLVIGDELTKHPDLRRAVIRTRLREDVRFLGFVPHGVLRVFYSRARAFLFPSLYEGFGLPPLEAMAHGTPVVTSNVSSLPEVLDGAALLVNPENLFDIARGIRQVLTDEALRKDLVRRGYEQVKRYSWERSAQQVLDVYRSVAKMS
jgi:glycosyltransferase involved in cell wall biosynthesis